MPRLSHASRHQLSKPLVAQPCLWNPCSSKQGRFTSAITMYIKEDGGGQNHLIKRGKRRRKLTSSDILLENTTRIGAFVLRHLFQCPESHLMSDRRMAMQWGWNGVQVMIRIFSGFHLTLPFQRGSCFSGFHLPLLLLHPSFSCFPFLVSLCLLL